MGTIAQTQAAGNAAVAGTAAPAPQPRLVKAAHEFEAQMMKELMKPMTRSASGIGDDSDQDEGSNGALGEFASEALAQALSQQGGFGIAKGILHSLAPASQAVSVPATLPSTGNQNERVPVNTKPPIDTV